MANNGDSLPVTQTAQNLSTLDEQISLFNLAITEVEDSVDNADGCVRSANATSATLEIVSKELTAQIESLVESWNKLKYSLVSKPQTLDAHGKRFRSVRRTSQNSLQSIKEILSKQNTGTPSGNLTATIVHSSLPVPELPKLKIPVFDGNISKWSAFWDTFDSLVHSRTDLADVVKFATLRNYLSGNAFKSVEGLAITNSNYNIAIRSLCHRYNNNEKILSKLLREFHDLPVPRHNHDELLGFKLNYEKLIHQINHLENQDVNSKFFRESLVKKLPAETFKILANKYDTYSFTIEQISAGLDRIVDLMEMCDEQPQSSHINSNSKSLTLDRRSDKPSPRPYTICQQPVRSNSALTDNIAKSTSMRPMPQSVNLANTRLCLFCNQPHSSKFCSKYPSVESRRERIHDLALCFCCLKSGHRATDCTQKLECRNCNRSNHHTFLCYRLCNDNINPARNPQVKSEGRLVSAAQANIAPMRTSKPVGHSQRHTGNSLVVSSNNTTSSSVSVSHNSVEPSVLSDTSSISSVTSSLSVTALATATTQLAGGGSRTHTRTFFDSGAQKSFIQTELAKELRLPVIDKISLALSSFGNEPVNLECDVVRVVVRLGKTRLSIHAVVFDKVNTIIKTPGLLNVASFLTSHGIKLADKFLDSDNVTDIGLIIGADYYHQFISSPSKCAGINILSCAAGAIIFGPLPSWAIPDACASNSVSFQQILCARAHVTLESKLPNIENLWSLDAVGIVNESFSPEERTAIERFENSIVKANSQYSVDLPFKSEVRPPVNFRKAYGQLTSLMRSFQNKPELFDQYDKIFIDYKERDFIERVEGPIKGHYLPHHGVTKDSVTTPLRIVFNASSKSSPNELSLNDCLLTGPSLTTKLFDYLLAFRTNPYAAVADISKAFLRIGINESYRDYTRFLWYSDLESQQLATYRFKVVMFGATSSPFLLQKTLTHHLEQHPHPLAKQLTSHFYVDNFSRTYPDANLISEEYPIINKILLDGNMPLQSWTSNSPLFNSQITADTSNNITVLGLDWDVESDKLSVRSSNKNYDYECGNVLTKRKVVSIVSSVFDPLGLVSPLVIRSKVFFTNLVEM